MPIGQGKFFPCPLCRQASSGIRVHKERLRKPVSGHSQADFFEKDFFEKLPICSASLVFFGRARLYFLPHLVNDLLDHLFFHIDVKAEHADESK